MSSSPDPAWVQVQKRTFTNWVNIQLAERSLRVDDLQTDFMDGVSLINLVELLSKGSVGKYNKRSSVQAGGETTNARQHALNAQANINIALTYLKEKCGIKFVNIGSSDFAEGNLRIILGLVWTLILNYQIQEGGDGSFKDWKEGLLKWVRSVIGPDTAYGLDINNFKSDWQDGRALSALVDAFAWRSVEDWNSPTDPYSHNYKAIMTAQDKLSIPGILSPSDVGLDDLSLLCYLDYFFNLAKKRPVEVRPKGSGYGKALFGRSAASSSTLAAGGDLPEPAWKSAKRERDAQFHNVRLTWH